DDAVGRQAQEYSVNDVSKIARAVCLGADQVATHVAVVGVRDGDAADPICRNEVPGSGRGSADQDVRTIFHIDAAAAVAQSGSSRRPGADVVAEYRVVRGGRARYVDAITRISGDDVAICWRRPANPVLPTGDEHAGSVGARGR